MAPTTTTAPIFPPLSRTYKSQPYLPTLKRKRSKSKASYEVRPSTNGVGVFAVKPISCGDLIIEYEHPIVHHCISTKKCPTSNVCDTCSTPVGSLRENHLMAPPRADITLPYLDDGGGDGDGDGTQGLVFTTDHMGCQSCKEVVWCSEECYLKGRLQHTLLCGGSSPLNSFYSAQDNPIIFQLATQSVTLVLSTLASLSELERESYHIEQFYFWKDYGSHPLWWEIVGSSPSKVNEKKDKAKEYCQVLQETLLESAESLREERKRIDLKIDEALIFQIVTLENIGSLLGMLQCNVMEYEYPSPTQQYMEHVEEILEHHVHEDEDDSGENSSTNSNTNDKSTSNNVSEEERHVNNLKAGCDWLVNNIRNNINTPETNASENDKISKQGGITISAMAAPIKGSGLYPLLTLANHDCHPNASIDFLQESNRGSMVATRDIAVDEEICITYVPNGGLGSGDSSEYFRHFGPTCTWKWLSSKDGDDDDGHDDDEDGGDDDDDDDNSIEQSSEEDADDNAPDDGPFEDDEPDEEEEQLEGSDQRIRANALLEYGFECQCKQCVDQQIKCSSQDENGEL